MNEDDICLWPDGFWCYGRDIGEMTYRSDDYEVIKVADPRYTKIEAS